MYNMYLRAGVLFLLASALALPACEDPVPAGGDAGEADLALSPRCHWDGASVNVGEWLECDWCRWRYCQCQPNGKWGHCTNDEPPRGGCDWTNPDWSDPACSEGGEKPCKTTDPTDWQNPSCRDSGGSCSGQCHGPRSGPRPANHNR